MHIGRRSPCRKLWDAFVMELTRFEYVPGGGAQLPTLSRSLASTSTTRSACRAEEVEPAQREQLKNSSSAAKTHTQRARKS